MRPAALVLLLVCARSAAAQPAATTTDAASAQSLFDEANAAIERDDWDTACPKFKASQALDPSASSLIWMARCATREGHLATAWSLYSDAWTVNLNAHVPDERRAEVATTIRQERDVLEPKLGRLIIRVDSVPKGLVVRRDSVAVPIPALGELLRVDPGAVVVHAEAPGFVPLTKTVIVGSDVPLEVRLDLRPEVVRGSKTSVSPALPPSGLPVAGWGLVGAGVALAAAALGTGIASGVGAAVSADECIGEACTPDGLVLRKQASALEVVAWTLGAGAATALAVGVPLVVVGSRDHRVSLNVGPSWVRFGASF